MIYRSKDPTLQTFIVQSFLAAAGHYTGKIDNWPGPKTTAALEKFRKEFDKDIPENPFHDVIASSFADPADVARFRACKLTGKTDKECFKVGDNGVGKWGDPTTGKTPMVALPPEDWEPLGKMARGAKVLVEANGAQVVCELRDTMPRKANIKNGAGIDLNPAAVAAIGLRPPIMVKARWKFI